MDISLSSHIQFYKGLKTLEGALTYNEHLMELDFGYRRELNA